MRAFYLVPCPLAPPAPGRRESEEQSHRREAVDHSVEGERCTQSQRASGRRSRGALPQVRPLKRLRKGPVAHVRAESTGRQFEAVEGATPRRGRRSRMSRAHGGGAGARCQTQCQYGSRVQRRAARVRHVPKRALLSTATVRYRMCSRSGTARAGSVVKRDATRQSDSPSHATPGVSIPGSHSTRPLTR